MLPLAILAIIAIAVASSTWGCRPKEDAAGGVGDIPAGGKLVGVSLASRNHNFFIGMEQGVVDELQAQGLQYEAVVAEDSASNQQQQVDQLIRKGVKAIIMVPVDALQAITAVEAANRAQIPVFCIDRRVTDPRARVTATIETDNAALGEAAAKHALKLLCDRRKLDANKAEDLKKLNTTIVHLWGLKTASSAQDRAKGIEKVINKSTTPGIRVILVYGDFNATRAQQEMAPVLSANPDVELALCHNDDNAIGALNAIIDLKKQREAPTDPKRILIVGVDGNKPALEAIRRGLVEATIAQQPILMGQETVRQVKKVLDGGGPDSEYIPTPFFLITREVAEEKKGQLWADQLRQSR